MLVFPLREFIMKYLSLLIVILSITGCSVSPEVRAARVEEQRLHPWLEQPKPKWDDGPTVYCKNGVVEGSVHYLPGIEMDANCK
jgi:hypothetical protein